MADHQKDLDNLNESISLYPAETPIKESAGIKRKHCEDGGGDDYKKVCGDVHGDEGTII